VAPLPPHITWEEAKKFMHTLQQGDPDERKVLTDTARQVLASMVGHKD
jgi:pyruvate dehydrogenase (quinone)